MELLIASGSFSLDSSEISEHIQQFYTRLYSKQFSWWLKLDGISFDVINTEKAMWMEQAFKESEVFKVVKALN